MKRTLGGASASFSPSSSGEQHAGHFCEEEAAEGDSAGLTGRRSCWTDDPFEQICSNTAAVRKLRLQLEATKPSVATMGGATMRRAYAALAALGLEDPAFLQELPPTGSECHVLGLLCPLYAARVGGPGGASTITGNVVAAIMANSPRYAAAAAKRARKASSSSSSSSSASASSTIYILHKNFNPLCWRKGENGVEPRGGAAGCCDPTKENFREWGGGEGRTHWVGAQSSSPPPPPHPLPQRPCPTSSTSTSPPAPREHQGLQRRPLLQRRHLQLL